MSKRVKITRSRLTFEQRQEKLNAQIERLKIQQQIQTLKQQLKKPVGKK